MADVSKTNAAVWPLVHAEKYVEAAQIVSDACGLEMRLTKERAEEAMPVLQSWLHFLLNNDMREAARLLWTPTQFTCEPESSRQIWDLFDQSTMGLLMGAASMSKSFTMGVRLLLEWLRDPQWTAVNFIGPSEEHLERNLFSHIVNLHTTARLPLPGTIGERWIGFDRKNAVGAIMGVVIPLGRVKKAARLQGTKRKPRSEPHRIFGPLSRLFIFIDEIENVPPGIWHDIDNILSNRDSDESGLPSAGFKLFGAYNPTNRGDEVAKRAEPQGGWETFDVDRSYRWKSRRGWDVLRLDGERCENVVQGKMIYPGLQSRAGLATIALNSGGKTSAGYHSMGRGAYPPQGMQISVLTPAMFAKMRGEFVWADTPISVAGADLSLEGNAGCVFTHGKLGMASGMKLLPCVEYPEGRKIMFKDRNGQVMARPALLAEGQFKLPKGDTMAMATGLIELCKKCGVRPEYFCCDRTGAGAGTADMIKTLWSPAILDVNYSDGASDSKIMQEDTKTCAEQYERVFSELWFALRFWAEFNYIKLHPSIEVGDLQQQCTQRLYRTAGGKTRVESKKDYKSRGFQSPDEADSLTLFLHAARKAGNVIPSMKGDSPIAGFDGELGEEDWGDSQYPNGVRIDPSNMCEALDV